MDSKDYPVSPRTTMEKHLNKKNPFLVIERLKEA